MVVLVEGALPAQYFAYHVEPGLVEHAKAFGDLATRLAHCLESRARQRGKIRRRERRAPPAIGQWPGQARAYFFAAQGFLAAHGFFAAQGFLAAHGFAAAPRVTGFTFIVVPLPNT